MVEIQVGPLSKQEAAWVESRLEETKERFNFALAPLAATAARGGHTLAPYSDEEIRRYLTRVAIKARRSA